MYDNNSNEYPNYAPYENPVRQQEASAQQMKDVQKPKKGKKKKEFLGRLVKTAFSGVIFGLCAGCVIVIMLYFMTPEADFDEGGNVAVTNNTNNSDNTADTNHTIANSETKAQSESINTVNVAKGTTVTDVSEVVADTMPSVVSITGIYKVESYGGFGFGGFPTESESEGSGSGIIVGQNDTELLIATNNHVVEEATSLSVQFIDDSTAEAVVKGTDADGDLAVIAIPLEDIPEKTKASIKIATLGDSDSLKAGEPVIAIGNALGYGQSVTTGVVSAANREYTIDGSTAKLIQTDAAINPGNSGGALLNATGEVIGINSSKIGGSVIEGMGYAIPISTAEPIIEELMAKTTRIKVAEDKKAYLGIVGISVTEDVQESYGLPEGVYVTQVFESTAASDAGLVKGDIITSFDGEKVSTMEDLSSLLECYEKGTAVEIKIMQGSPSGYQEKMLTVTLGGRAES